VGRRKGKDVELAFREATQDDFAPFYNACFFRDRDNAALREAVGREWRVLLKNPATISMVVEDGERPPERRLVGCGQLAFVTDEFVEWARTAPSPRVNSQATRPLPDGSWPLLTLDEVAKANARAGLNGLFTRWGRANDRLTPDEQPRVSRFMHEASEALTRGYQFKELLIEAIGEAACDSALRAGFVARDCARTDRGDYPSLHNRPFLLGLTRDEAREREGGVMSYFFVYSPPRFGFTPEQQKMLRLCRRLPEASDEALAQALGESPTTVKNWWRAIYGRMMDTDPDLLPVRESGARGLEKKRRVLHYLREHPEELRPYNPPRRRA
jgi:DNA-binding CsgD family transcriptional regulator